MTPHDGGRDVYTKISDLSQAFHIYAVEWQETEIRFYIDNDLIFTVK